MDTFTQIKPAGQALNYATRLGGCPKETTSPQAALEIFMKLPKDDTYTALHEKVKKVFNCVNEIQDILELPLEATSQVLRIIEQQDRGAKIRVIRQKLGEVLTACNTEIALLKSEELSKHAEVNVTNAELQRTEFDMETRTVFRALRAAGKTKFRAAAIARGDGNAVAGIVNVPAYLSEITEGEALEFKNDFLSLLNPLNNANHLNGLVNLLSSLNL